MTDAEQRNAPQERVPRYPEGASRNPRPLDSLLLSDSAGVRRRQTADNQQARERLQQELRVPSEGWNAPEYAAAR